MPNERVEQLRRSSAPGSRSPFMSHQSMTVLGLHSSPTMDVQSPTMDLLRTLAKDDDDDDGEDGVDDMGDDAEDSWSSPPPLLSPSSRLDSPAAPLEPSSRPESKSPPASAADLPTHAMGGGDVVLIANLPEVFTAGYDSISFTARFFGGVREIPPGPHFFWVTHPSGASARHGFWTYSGAAGRDHVHLLEWDRFYEVLAGAPAAEARTQAARIERFYAKLAPYANPAAAAGLAGSAVPATGTGMDPGPTGSGRDMGADLGMWRKLTEHVSDAVLDRVAGRQGTAWHVHTADRVRGAILLAAEMELEKHFASPVLDTRELRFAFDQHAKTYSAATLGSDRSLAARDPTDFILGTMDGPDSRCGPGGALSAGDVIGELQFAYVTGMHLGNDACIQQWWHMVLKLFLKAHDLVDKRPALAAAFLQAMATQLVYGYGWLDGSILDYGDATSRDLRLALTIYKRRLEEKISTATTSTSTSTSTTTMPSTTTTGILSVATAFARLEAGVAALGWDIGGDYVRTGKLMLEDGEEVELEMTELEAEDERGEWAPEVVEMDENGRERGLVSWSD